MPPYSDQFQENHPIVRMLHAANVCFARIYHQLEVRSPCVLPRTGPAIIVSNHTSSLDPLLIQSVSRRPIIWMMAREYYELPVLKWIFQQIHAIPVERSGRDSGALRAAMRTLQNGHVLGIFPEGKIEIDRQLLPFQTGVSLMAIKAEVDIYPAYLDGTQRGTTVSQAFLQAQHASVSFGMPIARSQLRDYRTDLEIATNVIKNSIQALRQPLAKQELEKNRNIFPTLG